MIINIVKVEKDRSMKSVPNLHNPIWPPKRVFFVIQPILPNIGVE